MPFISLQEDEEEEEWEGDEYGEFAGGLELAEVMVSEQDILITKPNTYQVKRVLSVGGRLSFHPIRPGIVSCAIKSSRIL